MQAFLRLAALLTAGIFCATALAAAATPPRDAYVNLALLMRSHPLWVVLVQDDREIAALRSTDATPASIGWDIASMQGGIRAATARIQHISSRQTAQFEQRQSAIVAALLSPGNRSADFSTILAHMRRVYTRQSNGLQSAAQIAMARYAATLVQQEQTVLGTYSRTINARMQLAYAARAQELRESESALALDLARTDASSVLRLRLQLGTLVMDGAKRKHLRALLAAGKRREAQALAVRRAHDATILSAFRAVLTTREKADESAQTAASRAATAANLDARRNVLLRQLAAIRPPLPSTSPARANERSQIAAMRGFDARTFRSANASAIAAMQSAGKTLDRRLGYLRATDASARKAAHGELVLLQAQRGALYREIIAQIMRIANSLAAAGGFASVSTSHRTGARSTDLTTQVARALQRMRI